MPRPPRVHVEGALSCVTSRAMDQRRLFRDDKDYEAYLELLEHYQGQFGFKVFAYVLLPDHLHLCLELTGPATLSAIMHALNSRYTKYFAGRYGHTGHLFQARFRSTVMEKAPALLRVTAFLHTHPVRAGVVSDLGSYGWSSYSRYLAAGASMGETHRRGEVQEVLRLLSQAHPGMTYERYVQSLTEVECAEVARDLQRYVAGSEAFVALVQERCRKVPQPEHILRPQRPGPVAAPVTNGHSVHTDPGPLPQPRPSGSRREPSWMVTASLMVAFVSLCAAALYGKNLVTLKHTVRILARERASQFSVASDTTSESAGVTLASFTKPVHLGGTLWELDVRPVSGMGASVHRDRVTFQGGRFSSTTLTAEGFLPARYTVTSQDDGSVTWEAVQADRQGTIVSWQGVSDGRTIHGTMTRQEPGQAVATLNFVGTALSSEQDASRTMREI